MSPTLPKIRIRLSVMMFLQFFLWAAWYVPIGGYLNYIGFSGKEIGWIYTTTAIGAMISPLFVGYIADRYFSTERVLGVLHLVGALCLFLCAPQEKFWTLMVLLVVNGLCFMPTLALANSLAFRNIDDRERFSLIAVWGTIAWITAVVLVEFVLHGAKSPWFFYLAGAGAVVMAIYSFTLPHTPPKGAEEAGGDVLGLRAVRLLKEPFFLVFAASVFLISIPLSYYFQWGVAFLQETGRPAPVGLTALGQCAEIGVMLILPLAIARLGLKYVLVVGMGAWVLRYLLFATDDFALVLLGILVHGFCYCFVFVASFIYADKTAPRGMSASAQSFIAFLMWGLGMFVGFLLAGETADQYGPQKIAAVTQVGDKQETDDEAPLPAWPVLKEQEKADTVEVSDLPGTGESRVALVGAGGPVVVIDELRILGHLPEEGVTVEQKDDKGEVTETTTYAKDELLKAFKEADADEDGTVTKAEWYAASTHTWPPIWLWPCALSAVVFVVFLVGGREAKAGDEAAEAEEPAAAAGAPNAAEAGPTPTPAPEEGGAEAGEPEELDDEP